MGGAGDPGAGRRAPRLNWPTAELAGPGWLEADTVAHCGESMSGDFVWSLTMTDVQTQWTETRAVWNKGQHGVQARIAEVEAALAA